MSRIEQNDFLYSLMTNPEDLVNPEKPFEFHPIEYHNDPTLEWKCDA